MPLVKGSFENEDREIVLEALVFGRFPFACLRHRPRQSRRNGYVPYVGHVGNGWAGYDIVVGLLHSSFGPHGSWLGLVRKTDPKGLTRHLRRRSLLIEHLLWKSLFEPF